MINCAGCKTYTCYNGQKCERGQDFDKYQNPTLNEFKKNENKKMAEASAKIEGAYYMQWTRIEEIMGFALEMGYKKIGIALCVGLINEAQLLKNILVQKFEVPSICCKFSGLDKKSLTLPQIDESRYEAICNPIGQAMVLNDQKTDMNIIVGLCVGHDMLFTKYSNAPVTTFIVKDRITGHNPAVTLYSKYYQKKLLK